MFRKWLSNKTEPTKALYPPGQRIYCVGDIHGRADLLAELHGQIESDAAGYEGQCQVLYVGDYIDRGEASSQVLDTLLNQPLQGFESIYLLGNHEQAMLDFLLDPVAMAAWLSWGGAATLRSYGINPSPMPPKTELETLRGELERALPQPHLDFLKSCQAAHAAGDYYFVHAGIRPGVALEKQAFEDQLWIRDEFLRSKRDHGAIIVHGHNINEQVDWLPNRIGIDTGAYYTEKLTCLVLEDSTQRLLQTGGDQ